MTSLKYILIILLLVLAQSLRSQDIVKIGPAKTKVVFQSDKKIFPCKWRNEELNPEVIALDSTEIPRMLVILEKGLGKYPPKLIKRNLKNIYVLNSIFFSGIDYGGTYYRKRVYISNNGIENGYTDSYLERSFHHEFSSVLLKRHIKYFDKEGWVNANADDFSYGEGGKEALLTNETDKWLNPILYQDGFLNIYSLAAYEEDFNCFAEYIFTNDPGFWAAWESSEAIRKKTEILIQFYNRLNPIFTLEYFRGL